MSYAGGGFWTSTGTICSVYPAGDRIPYVPLLICFKADENRDFYLLDRPTIVGRYFCDYD